MERHIGIVRQINGGTAHVAIATGGCGGCGQKGGCSIGRLAGSRHETLLALTAPPGLATGDQVTVELASQRLISAALAGYLLPATTLIVGAIAANAATRSDAGAAAGALVGLIGGVLLARVLGRWWPQLQLQPTLAPRGLDTTGAAANAQHGAHC